MDNYLEEFGKIFIKEVRDRTIDVFDRKTQGLMKSKESQLLFERVNKLNDEQKSLISDIIPQIVDLSIHNMLCLPYSSVIKSYPLCEARFEVINKWYQGHVEKIDADVLARICYILDCNPGDIILYKVSDE